MVDHLVALGRTRLIHIAGPAGNLDAQERAEAFRDTCAANSVHCEVVQGDFAEESGEAAIEALLRSGRDFDAVFAANDNMALGALQALRAAGKRVPEDVAVAGFDDIPLAKLVGLTTVRVRIAAYRRTLASDRTAFDAVKAVAAAQSLKTQSDQAFDAVDHDLQTLLSLRRAAEWLAWSAQFALDDHALADLYQNWPGPQ